MDKFLTFSKTYKLDDDWAGSDLYEPQPVKKRKTRARKLSKKELLDALEEHNDGYIYEDRSPYNLDD